MVWLPTAAGKREPVNAETVAEGDVQFDHRRHVSHFSDCPQAARFRRSKADHVRAAGQTREHTCHWPGCTKQVPPAMWGCRRHWFLLPAAIRNAIWRAYQPGQEDNLARVSEDYLAAAEAAQTWIRQFGAGA